MDAAALTPRLPLTRRQAGDHGATGWLAFDQPGGPLVAVCGLAGGAGTTTLALGLARQAAHHSQAPILLSETDTRRAALATLTGCASAHSLPELARRLADGQPPQTAFTELAPGLRLIAATPNRTDAAEPGQLDALLDEARAAHGLVVVDCGADQAASAAILDQATHIAWTLPATPTALARAAALLASDALPPRGRARETLVATATQPRPQISVRALRRLASPRCERLILVPYSQRIAHGGSEHQYLRPALIGLAATLRRPA